jgi:hypothetical protein
MTYSYYLLFWLFLQNLCLLVTTVGNFLKKLMASIYFVTSKIFKLKLNQILLLLPFFYFQEFLFKFYCFSILVMFAKFLNKKENIIFIFTNSITVATFNIAIIINSILFVTIIIIITNLNSDFIKKFYANTLVNT